MRFVLDLGGVALAAGLALGGCSVNTDRYPPPAQCTGSRCDNTGSPPGIKTTTGSGGGGQGGAGGAGGSGGAAALIDQSGTVHRITSPDFQDLSTTSYAGLATIVALPNAGGTIQAPYGGSNGTTFTLAGVPSGATWLLVQDQTSGASGIISTFSYARLPVLGAFTLPVIESGALDTVASALPTVVTKGVSPLVAQVILLVAQNGSPFEGVSVTGGSGGAQIAYDSGAGYSDSATATGPGGAIILFNAGLSGLSTITLTDAATSKTYGVEVQAAPGTATLASVELQ